MSELYIVSKAGRLRSGSDNNWRRPICHYSERDSESGLCYDFPALCGASPQIMWSRAQREDIKVTCKKCKKLAETRGGENAV